MRARPRTCFALECCPGSYGRPVDVTKPGSSASSPARSSRVPRPTGGLQRRPVVRGDDRLLDVPVTGQRRDRRAPRHIPQRSTGRLRLSLGRSRASVPQRLPLCGSHSYPITPAIGASFCHALSRHGEHRWRLDESRPRMRSRPAGMALGAAFGGRLGVTATSWTRHGPQGRDDSDWRSCSSCPLT